MESRTARDSGRDRHEGVEALGISVFFPGYETPSFIHIPPPLGLYLCRKTYMVRLYHFSQPKSGASLPERKSGTLNFPVQVPHDTQNEHNRKTFYENSSNFSPHLLSEPINRLVKLYPRRKEDEAWVAAYVALRHKANHEVGVVLGHLAAA